MQLKKNASSLPSKEIRKGARLISFLVSDDRYMSPACLITLDDMMRLRESAQPILTSRPTHIAVNLVTERLIIYPAADKTYHVRQRWQLEYEVN